MINKFAVSYSKAGTRIQLGISPVRTLTQEEVLNLVAWLITVAGVNKEQVDAAVREIQP